MQTKVGKKIFIITHIITALLVTALCSLGIIYKNDLDTKKRYAAELAEVKSNILARDNLYNITVLEFKNEILNHKLSEEQIYKRIKDIKNYLYKNNLGALEVDIIVDIGKSRIGHFGIETNLTGALERRTNAGANYIDTVKGIYEIYHNIVDDPGLVVGNIILQQPLKKLGYEIRTTKDSIAKPSNRDISIIDTQMLDGNQYEKVELSNKEMAFYIPKISQNTLNNSLILLWTFSLIYIFVGILIINGIYKRFQDKYLSDRKEQDLNFAKSEENNRLLKEQNIRTRMKINFMHSLFIKLEERINYFQHETATCSTRFLRPFYNELNDTHIEGVISYFYDEVESKNIKITYTLDKHVDYILCDVLLLQRILLWKLNEIINIIPKRGIVKINIKRNKEKIKICISDNRFHSNMVVQSSDPSSGIACTALKDLGEDLAEIENVKGLDITESKRGFQGNEIIVTMSCVAKPSTANIIDIKTLLKDKARD